MAAVCRVLANSGKLLPTKGQLLSKLSTRNFSVSKANNAESIGFIGLGNMGAHMARNLLKHDYDVTVYDVNSASVKDLQNSGAKVGSSPAEVAGQVKQVVTMLPSSPNVLQVYTQDGGIFQTVQSGTLLIDSSTIDPAVAVEMAALAADKGCVYMDAPVSGGVVAARDAGLTFMVGGPEAQFSQAQAILSKMGKNVVHCGHGGTGQAAKICNNMLLGISMIGTAETMNLGIKLGLDPAMLAKILNMSTGRCWSSELYNPVPGVKEGIPASNRYQGGFGVTLMAKDLGLAQNAATATKSPTPMGSLAHQMYRVLSNTEYAGKDFASVYQFLLEQEEREK